MYSIPSIEAAVSEVVGQRAQRIMHQNDSLVLDDSYRAMFKRMGAIDPQQAKGLGYCINAREKGLLCEYLFTEAGDSEKGTLIHALLEEPDYEETAVIYSKCLEKYSDESFAPLFKKLRTSRSFIDSISRQYGIKADAVFDALIDGSIVEYLNTEAGLAAGGSQGGYSDALANFGVERDSELFHSCAELYVVVCDAKEYRKMGVDTLCRVTGEFTAENRARLLRNMLSVMDDFQLQAFVPMLEDFIRLTGDKGSDTYLKILEGVSSDNIKKYDVWSSKFKIHKVLGEGQISKFWYDYAGQAKISVYENLEMILIDFGKCVVLEIRDNEAAYFYDKDYFTHNVSEAITGLKNPEEAEEWLRTRTDWSATGDHVSHWRKAHTGPWQLEFREYVWKYA